MKKIVLLMAVLFVIQRGFSQSITLDPSFGNGGIRQYSPVPVNNANESGLSCFNVPGNKLLYVMRKGEENSIVSRRLQNGEPDSSYGVYGFSQLANTWVLSAAAQPDGSILILAYETPSYHHHLVIRLDSTGLPDRHFGKNGIVTLSASITDAQSFAVLPDGKIILAVTSDSINYALRLTQQGDPDPSFGNGGLLLWPLPQTTYIAALSVTEDGKFMAAGTLYIPNYSEFLVARFFSDGRIDSSFNGTGMLIGPSSSNPGVLSLPGGKILTTYLVNEPGTFTLTGMITRLNNDGTTDSSFNGNGAVRNVNFPLFSENRLDIQVQPDGKILGRLLGGGAEVVRRWNADGSPDNGFGVAGEIPTPAGYSFQTNAAFLPDGKMIFLSVKGNGTNTDCAVYRYNTNGTPDSTFGNAGLAMIFAPSGRLRVADFAIGGDGKIPYSAQVDASFVIGRVNNDGSVDTGFHEAYLGDLSSEAALQDGKIIVKDVEYNSNGQVPVLKRLNSDGTLDNTFGTGGTGKTAILPYIAFAIDFPIAVLPDGKILEPVGIPTAGERLPGVVRYTRDGIVDSSYGNNGVANYRLGHYNINDYFWRMAMTVQPDGKLLLAGIQMAQLDSVRPLTFIRLNGNGSIDTSFGTSGYLLSESYHGITWFKVDDLRLQKDGKILVGLTGHRNAGDIYYYGIGRLNSNGTPDSSFGNNGVLEQTPSSKFVLLNDQKILVASATQSDIITEDLILSMYLPNGRPDSAFGNGGMQSTHVVPGISSVDAVKYIQGQLFVLGSRRTPDTAGALIRFNVTEYTAYCPADKWATVDTASSFAFVDDIDPVVDAAIYPDVRYRLSGATVADGSGSASGKMFNKGETLVTYYYAKDTSVRCVFKVTVAGDTSVHNTSLYLIVAPNPSAGDFVIRPQSYDLRDKIDLKLYDQFGVVVVESKGHTAGETITFGATLKSGTYYLQATQGATRKVVQLLKL